MQAIEHKKTKLLENDQYTETEKIQFFDYESGTFEFLSPRHEELVVKHEYADDMFVISYSNLCFCREKIAKLIRESGEENVVINSYIESGIRIYMNYLAKEEQLTYNNFLRQTIEINFGNSVVLDIGTRKEYIENFNCFKKRILQYIDYKKQKKISIQSGLYKVVFDPELTGLLVHELIGHIFEIDVWLENPILKETFTKGKKVTSDYITIMDNPCIQNGYGSYDYDDEGNKAKKTILIHKGYVSDFMKTRKYDYENRGSCNGRFVNIGDEILVRMSNTYMLPGKKNISNLLKEVDCGLYMVGNTDCTFSGVAKIIPREIYSIRNGRVCEAVRRCTVYIDPIMFLQNILGISSDFMLFGGGLGGCGKKNQWPLPIGSGGPFIAVNNLLCEFNEVGGNGIN